MKTLLIQPRGFNFYAKIGLRIPPLGLAYIAATIRRSGHEVKILDLGVEQKPLSPSSFEWPDIVGISADTSGYPEALSIAGLAKKSGKLVVMGGYHVTFLDKEALNTGVIDFVVRGEGEEIFLNLLNSLENKGDLSKVAGISYQQNGRFNRNKDAIPPADLNDLPFPARDLIPMKSYKSRMNGWPFTSLITSRGCPYNCYFCSSSQFGGLKWRARNAKSMVDEIEHLITTYGYKAFSFMDDNFTLNPQRVFEFTDELKNRGIKDIHWWCFSRVDTLIKNEEMVKRMAESGAYMMFLGLESNSTETLQSYNKRIETKQQQDAIRLLKKYRIEIHGSFILGDIFETREMAENTINWAKNTNIKSYQFSLLTPYPGTALYEQVKKENRLLHTNWELYNGLFPVIRLDYLTPAQMKNLLIKAYRKVYLNLSVVFSRKTASENSHSIKYLPGKIKSTIRAFSILLKLTSKMNKMIDTKNGYKPFLLH